MNIFWFRKDLRLSDNPALAEAVKSGKIIAIYILDEEQVIGDASKVWLHHSLASLNKDLDNKLNFFKDSPKNVLKSLCKKYSNVKIYWNRCYEPYEIKRDQDIKTYFKTLNIECISFNGSLLFEPWEVLKDDKTPYKVYTPFYKRGYENSQPREVFGKPENLDLHKDELALRLDELELLPKIKWYENVISHWQVGESASQDKLFYFLDNNFSGYKVNRDFASLDTNSKLSPHLHFGEISPNQVWYAAKMRGELGNYRNDLETFTKELAWREFSYYLLYHFPGLPENNFQSKFDNFPWVEEEKLLKLWQKGQTGYPIVDAGMRELWQTGTMHNRVRMIVASFLTKNLMIHWHKGRDWFWDCLFDADLASNSASWQWVAGSGADAAPYFRIFNPITQGEKFDPDGSYTLKYVPELKNLPIKYLFCPWEAPSIILEQAKIKLGRDYPLPIIDISASRNKALKAYSLL